MQEIAKNSVAKQVTRSSIIRLHDLLSKVNKKDENFIKYIPKQFFNEDLHHKRNDTLKQFARGNIKILIDGRKYNAKVVVAFTGTSMFLYDIIDFKTTNFVLRQKKILVQIDSRKNQSH